MKLRTFIALTLPQESRQFLSDCVLNLKKSGMEASFTKPTNFHLTLKFLGETEDSIIPKISSQLQLLTLNQMEFRFAKPGVFPKITSPRVVWYGVESENLVELAVKVDKITNSFGYELEDKEFVGHLTLARIKDSNPKDLEQTLQNLPKPPENQHFMTLEFIKSELNPGGSIYTPLWQRNLEGEC